MTRFFIDMPKSWMLLATLLMMTSCGRGNEPTQSAGGLARLLPDAPPKWRDAGETRIFTGIALSDYINGGSEAYFAYGFREVAARDFVNDAGARLSVEVYEMDRSENAFGIFSTDSAGEHWPIGAGASYGDGLLRFWKGPMFVRVMCYPADASIEAVIREIGAKVADSIEAESIRPERLLSLVPEADVVPDTVCYFHRQTSLNNIRFISDDNLLRLGDGVDAITWEQLDGGAGLRQIVLLYPSDSEARAAFRAFAEKYLGALDRTESGGAPIVAQTKEGAYAAAGFGSSRMAVVLDASSSEAATQALKNTSARLADLQQPEGS